MYFKVIPVFMEVLRGTFANLGAAVRMSWPWLLLLVPLQVAMSLSETRGMALPFLVSLAYWLAALLAGASIAVSWHRFLLLEEDASELLRLDRPVWRYAGNGLLLLVPGVILLMAIMVLVVIVPLAMHFGDDLLNPWWDRHSLSFAIAMTLVMVVPLALLQRLSLKFPAIALGVNDYGFRDSWRDTRGNFLRIVGFMLLTTAVTAPVSTLLSLWTPDMQAGLAAALIHAVLYTAWTLLMALFAINTLTVFYAIFVEDVAV